jgi:hypothetical protein
MSVPSAVKPRPSLCPLSELTGRREVDGSRKSLAGLRRGSKGPTCVDATGPHPRLRLLLRTLLFKVLEMITASLSTCYPGKKTLTPQCRPFSFDPELRRSARPLFNRGRHVLLTWMGS